MRRPAHRVSLLFLRIPLPPTACFDIALYRDVAAMKHQLKMQPQRRPPPSGLPPPFLMPCLFPTICAMPWLILICLWQLHSILTVSATTTVGFYADASCKNLYATIHTDTNVGDGLCGELPANINSASSIFVDDGCTGIQIPNCRHIHAVMYFLPSKEPFRRM